MITVVIPSYRRPEILFGVLMNIYSQNIWNSQKGEIIISVDDNDPTLGKYKQYIMQFKSIAKDNLDTTILINNSSGLVAAKRAAVEQARGNYIMMMDDDLYMESNYITELVKDLESNQDVVAVSGYIVSSIPAISHTQPSDILSSVPSRTKLQTLNIVTTDGEWRSVFGPKEQVMDWSRIRGHLPSDTRYSMDYFVNSYMFRKCAYESIDGYNNSLNSKTSAHEEVDFTYRLGKSTGDLLFNPFVQMWHITVGEGGIYKGRDLEESKKILEIEYSESLQPFIESITKI